MHRHAAYVPESALTQDELQRYRREVSRKAAKWPHLFKGEAARAGVRARILRERTENAAT